MLLAGSNSEKIKIAVIVSANRRDKFSHFYLIVILFFIHGCASKLNRKQTPISLSLDQHEEFAKSMHSETLVKIDHKYYQEFYNPKFRLSAFVVYEITAERLKKKIAIRKNKFKVDPFLVRHSYPYVKPSEYLNSGYDKGHLAPSADFQFSQEANDSTFLMSNIAPQRPNLNQDSWRRLEDKIRKWACGEERLTVITGPILTADEMEKLKSGLVVPPSFFKVIIDETEPMDCALQAG